MALLLLSCTVYLFDIVYVAVFFSCRLCQDLSRAKVVYFGMVVGSVDKILSWMCAS